MAKTSGIYKIINIKTNKVYIGSSTGIEYRFKTHTRELNGNIHINTDLQSDWNEIGCELFTMEIIETVDDPYDLPERESYYIKLYKLKDGVYNKSDPMYEYISGREDKIIVDKGKNNKRRRLYTYSKDYILNWLIDNYQEVLIKLRAKINKDQFMEKSKMDKWFLNNIKDEDVKNDDRIEGLINKMYNKLGYCILDARIYSFQLYNLGIKVDKEVRLILINKRLGTELYNIKYVKDESKKRYVNPN
jgi:group I intron endonuclease